MNTFRYENILIIGSNNRGKVKEFKKLLKKISLKLSTLSDFNIVEEIKENGCSFKENSYKKAYNFSRILKFPVIADDSGLVVISLKGRPGVHSSRYISHLADDSVKCGGVLQELFFKKNRKAFFKCVLSLVFPDGSSLFYEGICFGLISDKIITKKGFGYDPIFIHKDYGVTFSEMDMEKKGSVSHRGLSIGLFLRDKKKILLLIKSFNWCEKKI